MAIRDKLQRKIGKAFNSKLADAVNQFTGTYVIEGEVNPVTEQSTSETVTYSGRGVLDEYELNRIDGINILHSDIRLIALVNEVTDKPKIEHTIAAPDLVTGQSQRYTVVDVGIDPAAAHYEIQLRRA